MSIQQKLKDKLNQREASGSLRKLSVADKNKIDFCSNDYLGLARNPALHQRIQEAYTNVSGIHNGATGSRLISGNSEHHLSLEKKLASLFLSESALLFNSGYAANTAILSAIPQKGDTIIYDEYIHASLKEGARLSFANRFAFHHNDLHDLERKMQKATGDIFVVAESVYSMDGDFAPLLKLVTLCEKYGANLIWDEAHTTGVWGRGGNGIACMENLHKRLFARVYTFGKGPGVHGGCIAGSEVLIQYLINFARPLIYTTALPLHSLVSIEESFRFQQDHTDLQTSLHERIQFFRKTLTDHPSLKTHFIDSQSPIQAVKIGGNQRTRMVATQLQHLGFDVRPILSPTVKEGEERLRICLHLYNTEQEIEALIEELSAVLQNVPVSVEK
ncbi:aminotransferase class I/II-fold pyridoxal phosphate-dependent enzyme [Xanthocytophaga flava]|uniref:aminotransferase class I/II-fold pyridoxal phosphate-dependent enzyme n=1 Tax=Xanthocytophaga flava TaxID=3048013 RepID=UPI0028D202AC|nr:8-amino-7-oxononanoate synthase [Xanthocytophaga flavus]MDJ1471624.1 8-amino-7-oxononanoate synthase [Xanthocytophaga flavus]